MALSASRILKFFFKSFQVNVTVSGLWAFISCQHTLERNSKRGQELFGHNFQLSCAALEIPRRDRFILKKPLGNLSASFNGKETIDAGGVSF